MVTKLLSHGYTTLGAIAALAFIVACVAHEAVGHGGMCVAVGGHVTLVSSVYFHCSKAGVLPEAAGPLMTLLVGLMCWVVLRLAPLSLSVHWRLFTVLTMAFNLLWAAMYMVSSAVTNTGDWAFVLRDLRLQPNWLWRCLMGALGLYLYYLFLRLIAFYLPARTPLVVPYLAAGVVSCMAALFFDGPTLPAIRDSVGESFGNTVGLLLIAYVNSRRAESSSKMTPINGSPAWLLTSVVVTLIFFATLGRGFVFGGHA
jgi:hypothetical protein